MDVRDEAWRVVVAGLSVMILPGLTVSESLRMHAATAFEAIAKAFALSLIIATVAALGTLLAGLPIDAWCAFILTWNIGWSLPLLLGRGRRLGMMGIVTGSVLQAGRWQDKGLLFLITLLAIALYRAGNEVTWVGWEAGSVVIYARQVASGLPLDFASTYLRPELRLHNLFLSWQFMLGGLSHLAGVDPLIGVFRSRWLIPVLGFSCFFFFIQQLFGSVGMARRVAWVTVILILTQFVLIDPAPLVRAQLDDRPLFVFLGSIHHADAGLDILLPLLCGYLFCFLRGGRSAALAMLAALLIASFFFHPREYFQVMWYGVIAALAHAATLESPEWRRVMLQRYAKLAGLFLVVAGACLLMSHSFGSGDAQAGEFTSKLSLIRNLITPTTFFFAEPMMNFSMHYFANQASSPPNVYSWLALAVLLVPIVAVFGTRTDSRVAMMLILLWWITLCFALTQQILVILTYSQILTSKVRFLPLFTYAVIGVGWTLAVTAVWNLVDKAVASRLLQQAIVIGFFAIAGLLFATAWWQQAPEFHIFLPVWGVLIGAGVAIILLRLHGQRLRTFLRLQPAETNRRDERRSDLVACLALLLFVLPLSASKGMPFIRDLASLSRDVTALYSDENPTGLSSRTIAFLRTEIPLQSRVSVDPLSNHVVGLFAPIYGVPFPRGQISLDYAEIEARRNDTHPIFNSRMQRGEFEQSAMATHLDSKSIDYILSDDEFSEALKTLADRFPERFSVVFDDETSGDLILRVSK